MTRVNPTAEERAELARISTGMMIAIAENEAEPDDKAFAVSIDRKVLEPLRWVFRRAVKVWGETEMEMLRFNLGQADGWTEKLYKGSVTRAAAIAGLAKSAVDIRALAELGA